jgi:hypothetical protein
MTQLGKPDYYLEQLIKGTVGYRSGWWSLSVMVSDKILTIGRDERRVSLNALAVGLSGGLHYNNYHLGIVGDNLNRPRFDPAGDPENMNIYVYGQIDGLASISITGRLFWENDEKAIFSLGQYFNLPDDHGLFLGIQSDPLSYGGGIDIRYAGIGLTYAVSHHPVLGFTHNVSLTYSAGKEKEPQ